MQRAVVAVTQEAIRVCGGRAFLKRYPLERYTRDARAAALMRPWTEELATRGPGRQHLLGHAAGQRGPGVTVVGCEKDGAALPPMIAITRVDTVALPQEQPLVHFEHGSICAASGTTALADLAP